MASEWARSQREGWLCDLYGRHDEDGNRTLPPESVQSQLADILGGLLLHDISPRDAAAQTATLIVVQEDVSTPWSNHVGMHLTATQDFDDEESLNILVEYLVELASLPDAINTGPGTMTVQTSLGVEKIKPGQSIEIEGGKLWRDLPHYPVTLTESLQGPEQYLKIHRGHKEPLEATQAWKNINTYLALMAVHPKAQTIPVLARHAALGLRTLVLGLEYSSGTRLGRNSELHAPAAAQWLRIAGDQIQRLCGEETERLLTGDLWQSRGGTDVCDSARLAFWKSRLSKMGY